jgi:hypothetical protein
MHFGRAREHIQAAPPNSVNTIPADNEKVFVITRMAKPWNGYDVGREAQNRYSCGAQWLSTTQTIRFRPGCN